VEQRRLAGSRQAALFGLSADVGGGGAPTLLTAESSRWFLPVGWVLALKLQEKGTFCVYFIFR
jgi:hypothetical protein